MNRFIKYLFGLVLALTLNACTDWVDPAIPYNEFDTGLYLRTLDRPAANFNFFNLDAAVFQVTIEAVDIEDGRTLREVEVFVSRRRGPNVTPEVRLGTIPASAFQPHSFTLPQVHPASGSKFPAATIRYTLEESLTAMGMTKADINGGDFIEYRLSATDTQGRVFTNTNLSPDIVGGLYYRSPFFYRYPIVCPSELVGTYDLSTTGWCGETYTGKVRFVAGTTTGTYIVQVDLDGTFADDFSFGFYRACYGADTAPPGSAFGLRLTDACGQIGFNTAVSSPWQDPFFVDDVQVNGSELVLSIRSGFDPEAGVATITRTDGSNWPPLRK